MRTVNYGDHRSEIAIDFDSEAYNPEANKFALYVQNHARVFQPPNQKHGNFFAQIWNTRTGSIFFKMATAKKLTRAKISSLNIAGKALSENIVFERVSREAGTNFGYYFESCS